jgi:hypothetical protein
MKRIKSEIDDDRPEHLRQRRRGARTTARSPVPARVGVALNGIERIPDAGSGANWSAEGARRPWLDRRVGHTGRAAAATVSRCPSARRTLAHTHTRPSYVRSCSHTHARADWIVDIARARTRTGVSSRFALAPCRPQSPPLTSAQRSPTQITTSLRFDIILFIRYKLALVRSVCVRVCVPYYILSRVCHCYTTSSAGFFFFLTIISLFLYASISVLRNPFVARCARSRLRRSSLRVRTRTSLSGACASPQCCEISPRSW